jgi:hypothetical protein
MAHKIGHRETLGKPNCPLCRGYGYVNVEPERRDMGNGKIKEFPRVRVCDCRRGSAAPPKASGETGLDAQSRASGERVS